MHVNVNNANRTITMCGMARLIEAIWKDEGERRAKRVIQSGFFRRGKKLHKLHIGATLCVCVFVIRQRGIWPIN